MKVGIVVGNIWSPESIVNNTRNLRDRAELTYQRVKARGSDISLVEASTVESVVQAVGYLKNQSDGPVFFRGQNRLFSDGCPSSSGLRRFRSKQDKARNSAYGAIRLAGDWSQIPNGVWDTDTLLEPSCMKKDANNLLGWDIPLYAFEPMLQHYGLATRWLDLTDSLPYALFFSLAEYGHPLSAGVFESEKMRTRQPTDNVSSLSLVMDNIPVRIESTYTCDNTSDITDDQFVLFAISPGSEKSIDPYCLRCKGLKGFQSGFVIDMRIAVPSVYLRPHAQHGMLFKQEEKGQPAKFCIFRLKRGEVRKWLGQGQLFNVREIYPPLRRLSGPKSSLSVAVDTSFYQWESNLFSLWFNEMKEFDIPDPSEAKKCFRHLRNYVSQESIMDELMYETRNLIGWLPKSKDAPYRKLLYKR